MTSKDRQIIDRDQTGDLIVVESFYNRVVDLYFSKRLKFFFLKRGLFVNDDFLYKRKPYSLDPCASDSSSFSFIVSRVSARDDE